MAYLKGQDVPADVRTQREPRCAAKWPDCQSGEYNPSCCRWPKSCSVRDVPIAQQDCGKCGHTSARHSGKNAACLHFADHSWESVCDCAAYVPAAVRTGIACPTGEHRLGTVCTHPTEGATE